jgi:hypothetical protein
MECDEKTLGYLQMPLLSRIEKEELDELEREMRSKSTFKKRQSKATCTLIPMVSRVPIRHVFDLVLPWPEPQSRRLTQDHALPDLIWNQQTRWDWSGK